MLDASEEAQNMAAAADGMAVNLEQIPKVSKAGELALKGLSIAGNMFAMWVLSEGIKAFDDWIHRAERAKETAEEFSSSFEDMQKTQKENTATIAELNDEYQKLSQGVNALGDNVSLSTDEYNRYHEITNKVADLIPDLVQGFDAEGNAILKVKGNLADLNEEYRKKKQNEARESFYKKDDDGDRVLDSVFKNYDNSINGEFAHYYKTRSSVFSTSVSNQEAIKTLKEISSGKRGNKNKYFESKDSDNDFETKKEIVVLEEAGINWRELDISDIQKEASSYATKLQGEIDASVSKIENAVLNYAQSTDDYWNLGENSSYVSTILGNLSTDIIKDNSLDTDEGVVKFVNNIITAINSNKDGINNAFAELFSIDLDTTDLSPEEAQNKINALVQQIADSIGIKDVDAFKISLGFDVDGLVTNYNNAIKSASKKFEDTDESDLTKFFRDNSINTQEEINKWNEIANSCNDATEAKAEYLEWKSPDSKSDSSTSKIATQKAKIEELRKEYQEALKQSDNGDTSALDELSNKIDKAESKLANLKSAEFTDAWTALDNTDDDTLKNAKKELTDLADAGKLTVDELKCIDGVEKYFEEIGLSAEEAVKKINDLTDSSKQLSTLKSAIGSIQDAYSEKKENKVVGADTLSKMEAEFSSAGKAWDNYKQIAGSAKTSTAELKKAQDELATAYINSNNFLSGLVDETGKCTEANKQYYISQLEELGIKNAEEVVNDAIIQQKANLAVQSVNLENATASEIAELAAENNTLNATSGALNNYIYYKALASNSALSTSASVQNLITLASQCGIAKSEIQDLQRLLSTLNQVEYNNKLLDDPNLDDHAKMQIRSQTDSLNDTISYLQGKAGKKAKTNVNTANVGNVNVNPTKNGSGSGSGSKSSSSKQEIDWIDRKVTVLNSKISLLKAQFENLFTLKKKKNNLKDQITQTTKLINTYSKAYSRYMAKANSVKLSADLKKKVQNGQIKGSYKELIKKYGEKKADKISKYQDYYDKAQSAKQSKAEAKTQKHQLKREIVDLTITDYNNQLARKQTKADNHQYNLDLAEANGRTKPSKNYTNLIKNADKQKSNLEAQNKELLKYRKSLKKNSEEWYEIQQQIDDNLASMKDLTLSQVEWNNAIQDMKLDKFRNLSDLLDGIKSKFQALISLNSAQGYTESDADIAKEIKMGNNQIATNKGQINQQWDNIIEDATKKKSDKTGFGWGLSKKNANKFKSSYQNFLNGSIDQKQFEKELKSIGLTWNQVINNSELREGIQNIIDLETENLNIMTEQEQKYDELAQKRIDAMNDYIDKLKEANDQKSKALELEKLQQKLQAAKQNKSIMVYREGYGFNYEVDQSAVNEAQSALDDAQFDAFMDKLSKVVDLIQKGIDNGDFNLYNKDGKSLGDVDTLVKKYLSSISKELARTFSDLEFYEDNKGKVMVRQKGAAYANGVVNAPKGANSLVAEEKPEILVRDGQWNLLDKTQFIDTKPGDIIIDGDKTEELLKNGYIESSGKVFNQGMGNYESWIKVEDPFKNLPLRSELKAVNPVLDGVTENLWDFGMNPQQMIIDNLKLPDYSKLIQPRSVENNRTIHIDKVELQDVNDVQTMMRELEDLATINSAAHQRAWKNK